MTRDEVLVILACIVLSMVGGMLGGCVVLVFHDATQAKLNSARLIEPQCHHGQEPACQK